MLRLYTLFPRSLGAMKSILLPEAQIQHADCYQYFNHLGLSCWRNFRCEVGHFQTPACGSLCFVCVCVISFGKFASDVMLKRGQAVHPKLSWERHMFCSARLQDKT